ncbi:YibE/F family protein [Jeotgalibacillus proteolyticus]|uniref:YibE/F-like family protein n=1 Tax=Jeotgalibacillus proteolyticus TaxID=2082395 RepID=A0A2S5G9G9_9BACL|nr:YibE/F family protein [Jeotgalibacillus proteolyticus]PPA69561.1 yibE/F-like family protein [Jeotgalibacillus proteolyticus]
MDIFKDKLKTVTYKQLLFYLIVVLCCAGSIIFVHNNHSYYDRPIAQVIESELIDRTEFQDSMNNEDNLFTQHIKAEIKNGYEKGKIVELHNEFSLSKAYDFEFTVGDEVFINLEDNPKETDNLTGTIADVKRDKYLIVVAWVFIFTLLIVGRKQGLFSILSLAINAMLISYALDIYLAHSHISLLLICGIAAILFTVLSLLLVNGLNEKTYAAIISTLLGTFLSLLITYLVLLLTSERGLRFEELQFITRPYQMVFLAGLFLGSLGAVMDVAITMSSSIFGLYEENKRISIKDLWKSGMEVGKDIMGTMTNILLFAYVSGSIPVLILYFKNQYPLGLTLSLNLSLEIARALAGGIGIVLTIPIGVYITIFFVTKKRAKI